MFATLVGALALTFATPALAGPPVHVTVRAGTPYGHTAAPVRHVRPSEVAMHHTSSWRPSYQVNAWTPRYAPAWRSGWHWMPGQWMNGYWTPGHWMPDAAHYDRDSVWVRGYWVGNTYNEGYWRPRVRSGSVWVDGGYDRGGWTVGYWQPVRAAEVHGHDHHDKYKYKYKDEHKYKYDKHDDDRDHGHHDEYRRR